MSYLVDGAVAPAFARLMVVIASASNTQLTEERIRAYAAEFGDVEFEVLQAAFYAARRQTNWFPSIGEVRKQLGPSADDEALLAWAAFEQAASAGGAYASVEVEDGAAWSALLAVFGSWPEYCAVEEGPELAIKRQSFLAAYRQGRRSNASRRRLPGLCEASGNYPGADLASRVWAVTIRRGGQVTTHRDRPQLPGAAARPALGEGE